MPELRGSETFEHLTDALARESLALARYRWFAQQADVEGRPDAAALFRSIADGAGAHAHGHLEFLADVGDPASGRPIDDTDEQLVAALAAERDDHLRTYPAMAEVAREEGFVEVAEWFETLAGNDQGHVVRLERGVERLD